MNPSLIASGREVSDLFREQFRGYGNTTLTCGCGRLHFCEDDPNLDDEELEQLRREAEKSPRSYVVSKDAPMGIMLGGYSYVLGCPCEYGPKLEEIIWDMRAEIASYIARRSTEIVSRENEVRARLGGAGPTLPSSLYVSDGDVPRIPQARSLRGDRPPREVPTAPPDQDGIVQRGGPSLLERIRAWRPW